MSNRLITTLTVALFAVTVPTLSVSAQAIPQKESTAAQNPLVPGKADMEKARRDRESGIIPPSYDKKTKIETVRDQDNRVTEYVVTPGSTHIPYRLENQSERPIDSAPGGNSKSTLGTTKFIEIGW